MESINEAAYPAEVAGLNYNLYAHQGGVTLKLSGFNEKLPLLMDLVLDKFAKRDFRFAKCDFRIAKCDFRFVTCDSRISLLRTQDDWDDQKDSQGIKV